MKQEKIKCDFRALGKAIKEARKAKGLSKNELADQMNIALNILRPLKITDNTQACKHCLLFFSVIITFRVRGSGRFTMNRGWVQLKHTIPPWRELCAFSLSHLILFQNQPIAGMTSILPISSLLFHQSGFGEIVERPLYSAS